MATGTDAWSAEDPSVIDYRGAPYTDRDLPEASRWLESIKSVPKVLSGLTARAPPPKQPRKEIKQVFDTYFGQHTSLPIKAARKILTKTVIETIRQAGISNLAREPYEALCLYAILDMPDAVVEAGKVARYHPADERSHNPHAQQLIEIEKDRNSTPYNEIDESFKTRLDALRDRYRQACADPR